jgi:hypothetical protein
VVSKTCRVGVCAVVATEGCAVVYVVFIFALLCSFGWEGKYCKYIMYGFVKYERIAPPCWLGSVQFGSAVQRVYILFIML